MSWQDDIVRMAIPYAGNQVTVVLPANCKLDPLVHQVAATLGKRLGLVPLDHFSAAEIARVQCDLSLPGRSAERGTEYAMAAAASIGEDRELFAKRMPDKWRCFGL